MASRHAEARISSSIRLASSPSDRGGVESGFAARNRTLILRLGGAAGGPLTWLMAFPNASCPLKSPPIVMETPPELSLGLLMVVRLFRTPRRMPFRIGSDRLNRSARPAHLPPTSAGMAAEAAGRTHTVAAESARAHPYRGRRIRPAHPYRGRRGRPGRRPA